MIVYVVCYYDSEDIFESTNPTNIMIDNIFDSEEKAKKRVKEFIEKFKYKAYYNIYEVM
jgi:ABC-type enterochelin transport system substrate-binding protein